MAAALHGQSPAPAQKDVPRDLPVLQVTTRLVQVSVIVRDKKGDPVTHLTPDDFQVFDEGLEQRISSFEFYDGRGAPKAVSALPAGTFSNDFKLRGEVASGFTVVLLDALNTRWADQAFARDQILRFLDQVQAGDQIAIYLLGDSLHILHDFTSDAGGLRRALTNYRAAESLKLEGSIRDVSTTGFEIMDRVISDTSRLIAEAYLIQRMQITLRALEHIAQRLAGLPGRKNLIWVSGGFPIGYGLEQRRPADTEFRDAASFGDELERASRAVNQSNVAIYPVDARGLFTDPMDENEMRADNIYFISSRENKPLREDNAARSQERTAQFETSGTFQRGNLPTRKHARLPNPWMSTALRALEYTQQTMLVLADRTGGRVFRNSNEIDRAIRDTIDESRVTYLLGYYPTHGEWDGRFREIRVKVKQPGVEVRHRGGYLAWEEAQKPLGIGTALERQACASPLEATGIRLTAKWLPSSIEGAKKLRLGVNFRDIWFDRQQKEWDGSFDLYYRVSDARGETLWDAGKRVTLQFEPVSFSTFLREGVPLLRDIPLTPESDRVCVAVRDVRSGAIGTLHVSLGLDR